MKANNLLALFAAGMLCGCAGGPTHDWYKPTGATADVPFKGKAALIESSDYWNDIRARMRDGYRLFGTSDYRGKYPEMVELTAQARRVKAGIVIFTTGYIDTISGVRSFSLPNPPQTVTSQSYGNLSGSAGSSTYYGQTTTTVPGGYSHYSMPFAYDRFEVHAAFLGK